MPTVFVQRPSAISLERMGAVRRFLMIWTPALAGITVIAIESTPLFSASNTGHWLRPLLESVFGRLRNRTLEEINHILRKSGHFSFYGLLCVLFVRGWLLTFARNAALATAAWRRRSWIMGVAATFLVASGDEFHQSFLPSRTGLFSDVLLDTSGGIVVSSVVMGISWWIRHSLRDLQA